MTRGAAFFAVLASACVTLAQVDAPPPNPEPQHAPTDGVSAEFLRAGATRYWPSKAAADAARPSLLLQAPFVVVGPPPDASWTAPTFSREGDQYVAHIPVPAGSLFFGAGRHGVLPPKTTVNDGSGAPPWIMAVRPGAPVLGILVGTTAPCEIEVGEGVTIRAAAEFPVLETLSENIPQAVGGLAVLTGWMDLPPLWSLGYQHADASHTDAATLLEGAKRLRAERLPADGIWVAPGSQPAANFTAESLDALKQLSLHPLRRVPMTVDADAVEAHKSELLRSADGTPMKINSRLALDFTRASARAAWGAAQSFNSAPEFSMGFEVLAEPPRDDALFNADADLGGTGGVDRYGAIYPTLAARAAREACANAQPGFRPVLSTSARAPGVQRYASLWIPAHGTDDPALADSLRRLQAESLSARFMVGLDIPGAPRAGNGFELARWFGVAALTPMLRAAPLDAEHSCSPWDFASIDLVRRALERRSRLTPHLYTLVFEAFRYDQPIIRPLWTLDPADASLRDTPLLFLLGSGMLVDARGAGDLPAAAKDWLELDPQPDLPRLFVRPGTVIPMGPVRQHAGQSPLDPLELVVALDAAGQAQGLLYEDDGDGFNYTSNQGRVAYYTAQRTDKDVLVKMARLDGGWPMAKRKLIARVLLPGGGRATAEYWDALDTHVTLP